MNIQFPLPMNVRVFIWPSWWAVDEDLWTWCFVWFLPCHAPNTSLQYIAIYRHSYSQTSTQTFNKISICMWPLFNSLVSSMRSWVCRIFNLIKWIHRMHLFDEFKRLPLFHTDVIRLAVRIVILNINGIIWGRYCDIIFFLPVSVWIKYT